MDKAKKKRLKRYLTWACLALVVALLTVMPLMAKSEAEAEEKVASILSATAESGTITTNLRGGGPLAPQAAPHVPIPAEVKITQFLVKNGQSVAEGTPLARVDKVSVMRAITGVTETMEYLQEELEDARDERIDSTISATAGGRVKKIFAQEGESVQEVMLRDGCLAILSIDGLMAVKIENDVALTTGESVTVRFPDGGEVSGRVESNLNGVKVITVEDEGYLVGEAVTVFTKDGEAAGAGPLYIHNAWKATGYSGTISRVHTKVEKSLSSGSTLFTLTDTDYLGQMQHRANQHREYEQLLQSLLKMYESGTIDAPCDGVVSGVDQDSAHLLSAEAGEWEVQLLNNSTGNYRVILLSNVTYSDPNFPNCTNHKDCTAEVGEHMDTCPMKCTTNIGCAAKKHESGCVTFCTKADQAGKCTAKKHYPECIHSCGANAAEEGACPGTKNHYLTCIESCTESDGTTDCPATKTHKKTCIERCSHADLEGVCDGAKHHYSDCIESCVVSPGKNTLCTSEKHKETCYFNGVVYKAYAAMVGYYAPEDGILGIYKNDQIFSGSSVNQLKKSVSAVISGLTFPTEDKVSAGPGKTYEKNDIVLVVCGYKGEELVTSDVVLFQKASVVSEMPGMGDLSGMLGNLGGLSGMLGGFTGYGNFSGTLPQTQDEGLYDLDGDTLLTVTPQQEMEVTITLDEQDIAKVYVGMEAQVKVGALRGESFPARVTKVGNSGTNNGGSSKFAVKLTLDATEAMLAGMSVTAQLPLEAKENVLMIPLAALTEEGAKTLVYTALDEKNGLPTAPVEVETGVSDGEKVEILSGLNPGDAVYYSYYDTLELDTSAEADRFTFG